MYICYLYKFTAKSICNSVHCICSYFVPMIKLHDVPVAKGSNYSSVAEPVFHASFPLFAVFQPNGWAPTAVNTLHQTCKFQTDMQIEDIYTSAYSMRCHYFP